jgi:hypothetical protein
MFVAALLIASVTAGIGATAVWVVSMIDASKIATKINNGIVVGEWEFF